jgi:hypothetical protein
MIRHVVRQHFFDLFEIHQNTDVVKFCPADSDLHLPAVTMQGRTRSLIPPQEMSCIKVAFELQVIPHLSPLFPNAEIKFQGLDSFRFL